MNIALLLMLTQPAERHGEEEYIYDLYAVVVHHGRGSGCFACRLVSCMCSMNEGHFTSYGFLRQQGLWLLYNDSQVSVVDEDEVLSSQAYLLFYG